MCEEETQMVGVLYDLNGSVEGSGLMENKWYGIIYDNWDQKL